MKRIADVFWALLLLLVLSPLFAVIAIAVGALMGYPLLFRQRRPGLREERFTVYKFRTMTDERDACGNLLHDHQRVLPLGMFLRKTSLDELPQLWNIVRGDLSFVGPRPLLESYIPYYSATERRRHSVRPGLTGWAQVNGRNTVDFDDRLAMDVWYVDHMSFWLDIRILLQTIPAMLSQDGVALENPAHCLDVQRSGAYSNGDSDPAESPIGRCSPKPRHVLIIGAGGHAKVVIATLRAAGRTVHGILDDDESLRGGYFMGVPILGTTQCGDTFRHLEAIVAIGDNETRRELVERLDLDWTVAIHPASVIHSDVLIGPGTVVFAGAVIQPGAGVGAHAIINTAATVDHDCLVGDFAHIAPGAHLGGSVQIAEGAFVGIAATALPNICIGEWATLGGGAVAIRDVEARSVEIGVPSAQVHPTAAPKKGIKPRGTKWSKPEPQSTFIALSDPRWLDVLNNTLHDVYHLPEYLAVCAKYQAAEPLAFYSEDDGQRCLIPILLRRLPKQFEVPWAWCDMVSPYGYACPLFTHPNDGQRVSSFLNAFRFAADELGACSAFLRLHPCLSPHDRPETAFSRWVMHGETAFVDLTLSEKEMWHQTRDGHRSDIRRLERLNFAPMIDDWNFYGDFIRMYKATMLRCGADQFYYFPDDYFTDLKSALGNRLHLCGVIGPDGGLVAGGLFTAVEHIIEYHLSGSDMRCHQLAPTKLMLHSMRLWGKEHGYSVLHLGGGAAAQSDSLFAFKAGFSSSRKKYSTYRVITNERRYTALSVLAGKSLDLTAHLGAPFFPPYRESSAFGV